VTYTSWRTWTFHEDTGGFIGYGDIVLRSVLVPVAADGTWSEAGYQRPTATGWPFYSAGSRAPARRPI
jgi:hypothetical protein